MRTSQDLRGRRRAALVAATLGLACAPAASRAQVVFTDDFDTNSTSRYNVFSYDNAVSATNVVAGVGSNDVVITPAFNFSQYQYRYKDDNENTAYGMIPQVPGRTGTTLGLRLDVNNAGGSTGGTAVINLLPKVTEFTGSALPTGNYKLTVDVWMNYNGEATGGTGSTEYMLVGLNQQNPGPANGLAGPVVNNPTIQQRGSTIAIDGETGSGTDYRIYSDNSRLGDFDSSTGYVAKVESSSVSASNGENNPYYNGIFPFPTYESIGGIGKHWVTLEAKYQDGVTYYSIDAHLGQGFQLIASHTDRASTSGNFALGYADLNGGVAAHEESGPIHDTDASFVIYDNLSIEQLPASAAQPTWTGGGGSSWNAGGSWAGGTPNSATSVATFGASAAGSTVTVDSSTSVREVVLDNAGMTIGGSGPLVMDSPGGLPGAVSGGDMGVFTVKQGTHTVTAPVTLNENVLFHVDQAGSSLTFTQPIPESTYGITKSGAGMVTLPSGKFASLTMLGGKVSFAPGTGTLYVNDVLIVGSVAAQRGSIDLNDNKMVFDYLSDGTLTSNYYRDNVYLNIRGCIGGAYSGGTWTGAGLMSSLVVNDPNKIKGIGYWDASTLLGLSGSATATWFGRTVDATSVLLAVTYLGDLNFDGKVDGDDFTLMDRGRALYLVPTTTDPRGIAANRAKWVNGDLNYDGVLNAADYAIIDKTYGILHGGLSPEFLAMRESEFGADYVASLVASVPEPGTLGLAAVAIGAGLGGRRRRRMA